jgi:hypothetical protein
MIKVFSFHNAQKAFWGFLHSNANIVNVYPKNSKQYVFDLRNEFHEIIGSNFGDFGDFGEEVVFESFDVYSPNLRHKIENFGQNSFYRAEILTSLAKILFLRRSAGSPDLRGKS